MQTNNRAARRHDELVQIPSVQFPGHKFLGVTSPEIRQRNLARYKYTKGLYLERKADAIKTDAQATAEAVKAAFASAQSSSLVHRSVRKEVS
jgi:hypothetical protein